MLNITKDRTYTTRDGRAVRIYATDAGSEYPIHGAIKKTDSGQDVYWEEEAWTDEGSNYSTEIEHADDLIEALKTNGIPVDLPDPPEIEGYSWEIVTKGGVINADDRYNVLPINIGNWTYSLSQIGCIGRSWTNESDDQIFIRYIPDPVEEITTEQAEIRLSAILGKTVKIVK
jgi:hypothetical protein